MKTLTLLLAALPIALAAALAAPAATSAVRTDGNPPVVDMRDKQEPLIPVIPPMKTSCAAQPRPTPHRSDLIPGPLPGHEPVPDLMPRLLSKSQTPSVGDIGGIVLPKPITGLVAVNGNDDGCDHPPTDSPKEKTPRKSSQQTVLIARDTNDVCTQDRTPPPVREPHHSAVAAVRG